MERFEFLTSPYNYKLLDAPFGAVWEESLKGD